MTTPDSKPPQGRRLARGRPFVRYAVGSLPSRHLRTLTLRRLALHLARLGQRPISASRWRGSARLAELRWLAHREMRRERPGHTLQTAALVNGTYLRLVDSKRLRWRNRAHLFAVCARDWKMATLWLLREPKRAAVAGTE